jgi:hypothetical protein
MLNNPEPKRKLPRCLRHHPCTSVCKNLAVHLKQFRPLKENLKGARRAPCLSMTTPPPIDLSALLRYIIFVCGMLGRDTQVEQVTKDAQRRKTQHVMILCFEKRRAYQRAFRQSL